MYTIHDKMLIRNIADLIIEDPSMFKTIDIGENVTIIFPPMKDLVEYLYSTDYVDLSTIKSLVADISDISVRNIFQSAIGQWNNLRTYE
ncbi:hypothetical protein [Yersinia phage fHe-Yen9-03]|uniref:Uncharacterized protein n=1 Tax=Yersinia phage fHe-Yen9-03 TaxID=2052743 RepID=A0A2C9CYF2_9CAUD|nr:hypothetical protein [Yersinia phage fHe-Yen9-03]